MASLPPDSYLNSLNIAQLRAVEHPPHVPLQILAGPGSGKTKVLTSRIAHLILRHSIPPSSICAVTFTNKAANEMRERLKKILGKNRVGEVKMGTFHALCAQFLRRYAHTIALSDNFSICDADESKRIIKQLLKKYAKMLAARNMTVKEGVIMSKISQAKAKSVTSEGFAADVEDMLRERGRTSFEEMYPPEVIEKIAAETYIEYERLLRRNNSLDFDDLLLFGVKMFKAHRNAVTWCQHVLVDEFQDTNIIQYDLMRTIAHRNCVTIVGDPDQSIYGWRSAEVENLANMKRDFPGTQEIHLEENYRSTGAILRLSLGIISEDKKRIQKSLHTSHPLGKLPTLRSCTTELDESSFIADEIKRVIAYMGGLLQTGLMRRLVRFNALSRLIERALQKEGIPCRILGGHRFFERLEVKDLLAYLQLVDNPHFYPAFARAVNVPSRGVGEKTLLEIASKAETSGVSHLEVLERIYDGKIPDIKPPVKRKISPFITTIRTLRDLAQKRTSPADLLRHLLMLLHYSEHLKKTQTDWESRWANVEELINFATEVGLDAEDLARRNAAAERDGGSRETPLRLFVQASSLSSEGDNNSDVSTLAEGKVTIATCHAAKGLEWPVVMIPSVENGTFPLARSEDVEEERRLLYVACTRAQGLLYLTHAERRNIAGRTVETGRSQFVESVFIKNPDILTYECPELDAEDRAALSNILRREIPDEAEVGRRVVEYYDAIENRASHAAESSYSEIRTRGENSMKPPDTVPRQNAFTTASAAYSIAPNLQEPTTEPPMPSFRTSNRMLLFHTLERMHDNQMDQNTRPSSSTMPPNAAFVNRNPLTVNHDTPTEVLSSRSENTIAPARRVSSVTGNRLDNPICTVQSSVTPTEAPMPSFQTSNRMLLFHTLQRMHDNPGPSTSTMSSNAPFVDRGTLTVDASETLRSRSEHTMACARRASLVANNQVEEPIHSVQSSVTPNKPGPSILHTGVSNSHWDTRPMTQPVAPDPTWPMPNGSNDSQGLYYDFPKPGREERPAALAHNTYVSQVKNIWSGTPQTSQCSQDGLGDEPVPVLTSSESLAGSPSENDRQGLKRRLGMGRVTGGYTNKKFKRPC